ncbi:unnamed protein product [Vitrella brassicaformis CCMP3155]|uniref:Uncharacterized protein n=2 Tax=Vitrella brassicaformis TaxID=1169539 RepID=A0A0G4ETY7_VITBC|nr:unnamed protein product [Vitrella brassicaformis CCMP3155]|eukprot:CEM01528.1 unnamed protein product [Vitrella brassicaformis CCMP3155]
MMLVAFAVLIFTAGAWNGGGSHPKYGGGYDTHGNAHIHHGCDGAFVQTEGGKDTQRAHIASIANEISLLQHSLKQTSSIISATQASIDAATTVTSLALSAVDKALDHHHKALAALEQPYRKTKRRGPITISAPQKPSSAVDDYLANLDPRTVAGWAGAFLKPQRTTMDDLLDLLAERDRVKQQPQQQPQVAPEREGDDEEWDEDMEEFDIHF